MWKDRMKSPLHDLLIATGCQYSPAAEPDMPVHCGDPLEEYAAARDAAAIFDRSVATKIELRGPDRARFLHNLCTNDVKGLPAGRACEALITTVQAKILAHVRVAADSHSLWLDTVPGAAPALLAHLNRYLITEKVELLDRSADFAEIRLIGPKAGDVLANAATGLAPKLHDLDHADVLLGACECQVLRDDSLGVPGYDLRVPVSDATQLWEVVCEAGQPQQLRTMGTAAFEMLRVEAGLPVYGADIDESNLPQEVGRDKRAISFTKGCYLGQETVARIDAMGHVNRHLVGLVLATCPEPPPRGATISAAGKSIGVVTSAVHSPTLHCPIALGYVRRDHEQPGSRVSVEVAGASHDATTHALPFVPPPPTDTSAQQAARN